MDDAGQSHDDVKIPADKQRMSGKEVDTCDGYVIGVNRLA